MHPRGGKGGGVDGRGRMSSLVLIFSSRLSPSPPRQLRLPPLKHNKHTPPPIRRHTPKQAKFGNKHELVEGRSSFVLFSNGSSPFRFVSLLDPVPASDMDNINFSSGKGGKQSSTTASGPTSEAGREAKKRRERSRRETCRGGGTRGGMRVGGGSGRRTSHPLWERRRERSGGESPLTARLPQRDSRLHTHRALPPPPPCPFTVLLAPPRRTPPDPFPPRPSRHAWLVGDHAFVWERRSSLGTKKGMAW